jgi:hypothetical protein
VESSTVPREAAERRGASRRLAGGVVSETTPARVASDAAHQKIDREMDEAFAKIVAKNRKLQADTEAARKK